MLAAIDITRAPVGIDAERDIPLVLQRPFDYRRTEEDIRVGTDKAIGHMFLGAKERRENIVVRPVGVIAINKLRIIGLDLLNAVTADKNRRFQPGLGQRFKHPVENAPPANGRVTFWLLGP